MQREKLTMSCRTWAWLGWPAELDVVCELEPQAASKSATAATAGRRGVNMAQLVTGGRSHACNTLV
jgi:hypothetical protein